MEQINRLNKMLEDADADESKYDEITVYLKRIDNKDLRKLAEPTSGLNPFIRSLVKLQLPPAWFAARTEKEINKGGKRTRKNIKKRYAKNP